MSVGASIEPALPESSSASTSPTRALEGSASSTRRFADLRGVQWRIGLGILPSSSSIDDLRRVTADCRRRYAGLRRRLLVDPHIPKDGSNSLDLVMDNPLSQSPDSIWGRFFRNAELERTVDQDLSRLYPEHGSYFQTPGCQGMLRRILLLWCLRHPEYGYRQGMHELLAPLLYVLHADLEHLSHVRKSHEDHFIDKFGGFSFDQSELTYDFDFKKFSESIQDGFGSKTCQPKVGTLNELDPKIQDIVMLCDAYGAEGELGIVLSEKFMEHDAYCMFDALMSGLGGAVSMAEFFSSPLVGSSTGLPPVIEASSAVYHLLSIVDASLHSHLVALGVEPQYFALRWLRVLFGREFPLKHLLIVWDEIFSSDNSKSNRFSDDSTSSFHLFGSPRGAFISAVAVSMVLHMRSSLLATENATSCLQRLLNFPDSINLKKIIEKARSLQVLAMDADNNNSKPLPMHNGVALDQCRLVALNGHSLLSDSTSPRTPKFVPDSYWEEKWRNLHKAEELKQTSLEKQVSNRKKSWSEKVRLSLSRTQSAPSSPAKVDSSKKEPKLSVRKKLLEDLSHQLGSEEDLEKRGCSEDLLEKSPSPIEDKVPGPDSIGKNFSSTAEDRCFSGNAGSEENSSIFSDSPSPPNEHENQSERSSIASNLSINENDFESNNVNNVNLCGVHAEDSPLPISNSPEDVSLMSGQNKDSVEVMMPRVDSPDDVPAKSGQGDDADVKPLAALKERKLLSGKFTWFWKFGRSNGEGTSDRCASEATKVSSDESEQDNAAVSTTVNMSNSALSRENDAVNQNMMITLRNLGQSMLENIQVIEQAFQQERGHVGSLENLSKNVSVGKGQVTAVAALKELRKISNLLCEM